ncbi:MAG: hypothetical protein WAV89_12980 [Ignavibacteriaceae bacterium]
MGFQLELDVNVENDIMRFIGIDFTVDAEDFLLKTKTEYGPDYTISTFDGYQSFIGDIKIGKNILQVKSDDKVTVHSGLQVNLLETVIIKTGRIKTPAEKPTALRSEQKGYLNFLTL